MNTATVINELGDAEVVLVDGPTPASLSPAVRPSTSLVTPAATGEEIDKAFDAYRGLCTRLLDDTDYQTIGQRRYPKKSAWRKLAVAFGVSCEILQRDNERDANGRIVRTEIIVRATAPNGRYMDGLGACDLFEKCCNRPCAKADWSGHDCCAADCTGAKHFSHPQHDIPATASTRATNRACADLFGMGEVSAEEVLGEGETPPPSTPGILNAEDPWRDVLGNPDGWWDNREKNWSGPDFKAKKHNANWADKGEYKGKPDAMALWLRDAPEGFIEAISLRDAGEPVDFTLLDGAVMDTERSGKPDRSERQQANSGLTARFSAASDEVRTALVAWKSEHKPVHEAGHGYSLEDVARMHAELDRLKGVGAGEAAPFAGGTAASPATDGLAEANALASRPCEHCGSTRAKRVLGVGGKVVCANNHDCEVRAADRAAALKSPCAFAESHGCTMPAVKDGLCSEHEAF